MYIRSDLAFKGESCLLGTNVVMPLGLMVPDNRLEARGGLGVPKSAARVCLVGVQRVPGHCAVVLTAQLQEPISNATPVLFEPDPGWVAETDLRVEDSLLQPEDDGTIKLVVHNPLGEPRKLADPALIGTVQSCDNPLNSEDDLEEHSADTDVSVSLVTGVMCDASSDQNRRQKLTGCLNISETNLSPEDKQKL